MVLSEIDQVPFEFEPESDGEDSRMILRGGLKRRLISSHLHRTTRLEAARRANSHLVVS